ncbi:Putative lumazine-binding protein [Variovorax sp. PBS-H4]|uniref:nuclear transport factor 2 family protein n=1 Tax=Variovorax sp. PBS-H4 TaxID=434008 RepID=UPI0013177EAC|nr:nuclear transport factor 2 family protein [Variovorax sp. PBS-H4]VTU36473.1 Putative lumazine-binding protein [Variovorax sp. PBS-H4]
MITQDDFSPQRIADRMQIQHVMAQWCRSVDRLDFDGMRAVFHPDALDIHGAYNGDVDGLVDWIRERHSNIPFSMHAVSNMLIEFASADLALVETYVRTTQRYPAEAREKLDQLAGGKAGAGDGGMDLMTCSRYVDRFERRNGEWRIAHRTLVADWKQFVPVPTEMPKPPASWETGKRNQDDFVFRERRALGIA